MIETAKTATDGNTASDGGVANDLLRRAEELYRDYRLQAVRDWKIGRAHV